MELIKIDAETMQRLRIHIASEHSGKVYGKIGSTAAIAINEYIDKQEKYIDDLAKKAMGVT